METLEAELDSYYQVLARKVEGKEVYQLARFRLPETSSQNRTRILYKIMEKAGADGLIEWWNHGIIHKPRQEFYGMLISSPDLR